jgi:hypothetical protein
VLAAQFIASHDKAPEELVLDIDASDVPLHGQQELSAVPRLLRPPLLLAAVRVLRPGDAGVRPAAQQDRRSRHAAAVIKLLITRLRRAWPTTRKFIVRADSGFCRRRLLQWCERSDVGYIIGLARNARLHAAVEMVEAALADAYAGQRRQAAPDRRVRLRGQELGRERRVITRLEYGQQGTNPRFIVTNLRLGVCAAEPGNS